MCTVLVLSTQKGLYDSKLSNIVNTGTHPIGMVSQYATTIERDYKFYSVGTHTLEMTVDTVLCVLNVPPPNPHTHTQSTPFIVIVGDR